VRLLLLCVYIEPDQWIFAGCEDTSVRALDGETGDLLWTFSGYSGWVHSLAVSPTAVICGMEDCSVLSLDVTKENRRGEHVHIKSERSARRLATAFDHEEHVKDKYWEHQGAVKIVQMVDWADETSPHGRMEVVITASDDATVRALNVHHKEKKPELGEHLQELWTFPPESELTAEAEPGGATRRFNRKITSLAVVPANEKRALAEGNAIVIGGSDDRTVRALDAKTGEHLWCFPAHMEYQDMRALAGERLQTGTAAETEKLGQVTALIFALEVAEIDGSPDLVLTGATDRTVCALNLATGEQRWCFRGCKGAVVGLRCTGQSLLVLSMDHVLRELDLGTGRQHWSYEGRKAPITAMSVWQKRNQQVMVRAAEPSVGKLSLVECGPTATGHGQDQTMWKIRNLDGRLKVSKKHLHSLKVVANEGNEREEMYMTPKQVDEFIARLHSEAQMNYQDQQRVENSGGLMATGESAKVIHEIEAEDVRVSDQDEFGREMKSQMIEEYAKESGFYVPQDKLEEHFVLHFGEDFRLVSGSADACETCMRKRPIYGDPLLGHTKAVWCAVCARQQSNPSRMVDDETLNWHKTLSWHQAGTKHWVFEGQSGVVNSLAVLPRVPRFRTRPGGNDDTEDPNARRERIEMTISASEDCCVRAMDSSTGQQLWVFDGHATSVTTMAAADEQGLKLAMEQLDELEIMVEKNSLAELRDNAETSAIFQEVADLHPKHISALHLEKGAPADKHDRVDKVWKPKEDELKAALKVAMRTLLPATIVTGDKSAGLARATVRSISESGQELWEFDGHTRDITALAFAKRRWKKRKDPRAKDPVYIFSGSDDTTVRCLHPVTGEQLWVFDGHNESITALATSRDNVFSGSQDQTVRSLLIDIGDDQQNRQVWVFRHTEAVTALTTDRRFVYVGDAFGKILLLPAQLQGSGGVVRPVHIIADSHTTAVSQLCISPHRFTGNYLYSASNKIVLTPMSPVERLGIVTWVELADAGSVIKFVTQVVKPPGQYLARVVGRLVAVLQIASFAFTPETVPELPPEFQSTISFFGDFKLDLGGYDTAFLIAITCSAIFLIAVVVQEDIEFKKFMNPNMVRYQVQWLFATAISALSSEVLVIPVVKTQVRVLDCSKDPDTDVWYFDAKTYRTGHLSGGAHGDGGSDSTGYIDANASMECFRFQHMLYVIVGVVMMGMHIMLSVRLKRVYGYLELLEVRRNLFDFRGDSNKKMPAEHALSIERGEHACVEVICKIVIVASEVLGGSSLVSAAFLFFASGVLLFASFRIPPYYGFNANRALFALHFLVFWMCGTTLGALYDRFVHPDTGLEDHNSWWIDNLLVYLSFPLAAFAFLVVPYIPYTLLHELRVAKKKKERAEEKAAARWRNNEDRPHVLSWIDANHDGTLGRKELDRLLLLAGQHAIDDQMYLDMCAEVGAVPEIGFTTTQFAEIMAQLQEKHNKWKRRLPDSSTLHANITSTDLESTVLIYGPFCKDKKGVTLKKGLRPYGNVVRCTVRTRYDDDAEKDCSWALVTMSNAEEAQKIVDANGAPYESAMHFSVATAQTSTGLMKGLATRHLAHADVKIAETRLAKDETSVRRRTKAEWDAIEAKRIALVRREAECLPSVLDWLDRDHDGVLGRNELNRLVELMHYKVLTDEDCERMCNAIGVDARPDVWYWFDQVSDTWISYSEEDSKLLEDKYREWSGAGELVVDIDFDSEKRPRHRVKMKDKNQPSEGDGGGKSAFIEMKETSIPYDDSPRGKKRKSRRAAQAESEHGAHHVTYALASSIQFECHVRTGHLAFTFNVALPYYLTLCVMLPCLPTFPLACRHQG
jgi:WD40 repeat protein